MFSAEAKGLALLKSAAALRTPEVILLGVAGAHQFLLMEYVEPGERCETYWDDFAIGLAKLHQQSADLFGLDHNNYIGSLPQRNDLSNSWVQFFIEQRLKRQLQTGIDGGRIDRVLVGKFESLFEKLPSLLPEEPPSLLHGDLWGGNVMTSPAGDPVLIDPAVYYGHREVDLAMTQLFGGFDSDFLMRYSEALPLMPGYKERLRLYNLYPLLVHVNLFGGGYKAQLEQVLKDFT